MDEFRVESDEMIPSLRSLRYSSAGNAFKLGETNSLLATFHHLNESSALCVGVAARPETSPQQTNPSEVIQKHGLPSPSGADSCDSKDSRDPYLFSERSGRFLFTSMNLKPLLLNGTFIRPA